MRGLGSLGDEVDDSTDGVRPVEGGRSSSYHFYALDAREIDTAEVDDPIALRCQTFAIDEEEDMVSREALDRHTGLGAVGGDIDPRHAHLQGICSGARVEALQILARDHLSDDRELLQRARSLCPCDDDALEGAFVGEAIGRLALSTKVWGEAPDKGGEDQ